LVESFEFLLIQVYVGAELISSKKIPMLTKLLNLLFILQVWLKRAVIGTSIISPNQGNA
jgi:hypothetical protein